MSAVSISCSACHTQNSPRSIRCIGCGGELDPHTARPDASLVGRRIGSYEISGLLTGGSRSSIYRAKHVGLGRSIALKVLSAELSADPRARARFSREGRALARVEHPNVVAIHEVGEVDQRPFIAMALVEGVTLRARLDATGALPLEHAAGVARSLAAALAAIHAEGVVHRDVKPENVVFPNDGGMKLVDFGLARLDERDPSQPEPTLTLPGAVLGTLPYLAPEQLLGERVDDKADLWALGVVFFEMIVGATPFEDKEGGLVSAILERGPRKLAEMRPNVPKALADLVDGLMARPRADRPGSAKEVETRLVAAFPSLVAPELQGAGVGPLEAGDVVGDRIRLEAEIGRGSSGSVWRAEHLVLGTPCAVKFLQEDAASMPRLRARFLEEARTLAKLKSDNIVRILDAGTHRGRPYIAMELLEGETLEARMERRATDERVIIPMLRDLASGLDAAHQAGIVHRDLKPSNVFLVGSSRHSTVKIVDFGISKSVGQTEGSTLGGMLHGSVHYMSPEQIEPRGRVDHRTDLWSLAVMVFRLVTGKLPFVGPDVTAICESILGGRVPSFRAACPRLPPPADAWLARALSHQAEARFASATEMIDRLEDVLVDMVPAPGPPPSEGDAATLPFRPSSPTTPSPLRASRSDLRVSAPPPSRSRTPLKIATMALIIVATLMLGMWLGHYLLAD